MKEVDYIIVGLGIAGICFAEQLRASNKSFVVFNGALEGATKASGGVMNPTVLKRFTAAWNVQQFEPYASKFYTNVCDRLEVHSYQPIAVKRIFHSIEEQNDWGVASDKEELKHYLSSSLELNSHNSILAPYGFGNVKKARTINTAELLEKYRSALQATNQIILETFTHQKLSFDSTHLSYQSYQAKHIVFCEGSGVVSNPYFPLSISPNSDKVFVPNKGEYIIINAPDLQIDFILKGPVMIIPLGDDLYKVGASYGRDETNATTTDEAREYIQEKLKKMISCPFEVVGQVAGVRPTVKDRKPLLGKHPQHQHISFFNGLGTRGLTMAPLLSKQLLEHIEEDKALPEVINLARFL